jgi:DNA adenine methylase
LTVEQHAEILAEIQHFKGMVMLSGYQSPLYTAALQAWTRYETEHMADGARPRRECLWLNQACVDALGHGPLFAVAP